MVATPWIGEAGLQFWLLNRGEGRGSGGKPRKSAEYPDHAEHFGDSPNESEGEKDDENFDTEFDLRTRHGREFIDGKRTVHTKFAFEFSSGRGLLELKHGG